MDAIHYKVRSEGRIINKATYDAICINLKGIKEVFPYTEIQRCVVHQIINTLNYVSYFND